MRVGFDVSQTGAGRAGCGWYARSLIGNLESFDRDNAYILYPTFGDHYWSTNAGGSTFRGRRSNFEQGLRHRSLDAMQSFWRSPPRDWHSKLGAPQIVHSNNFFCPRNLDGVRLVYTLYDLAFLRHPEWSTESNRLACFQGVFDASLCADLVVAISEFTRADFLETFPFFPSDRITVISPASRFAGKARSTRPRGGEDLEKHGFWLNVGTNEPRKNLHHLLEAYAKTLPSDRRKMPLVLAGGAGWLSDDLQDFIDSLGIADRVHRLGYVDDDNLRWLYENCFAFVFPSLFEGFGMPVLEALQLGAPTIASSATSISEIVADAALVIDPRQVDTTTAAMQSLIDDPGARAQWRARGVDRARTFSWRRQAERLLEGYKQVLELPPRVG